MLTPVLLQLCKSFYVFLLEFDFFEIEASLTGAVGHCVNDTV